MSLLGYSKVIHFGIIRFSVMLRTNRQTDKQTYDLNILPTPTNSVSVGSNLQQHHYHLQHLVEATQRLWSYSLMALYKFAYYYYYYVLSVCFHQMYSITLHHFSSFILLQYIIIIITTNLDLFSVPFVQSQRLYFADVWSERAMNLRTQLTQKQTNVVWRPFRAWTHHKQTHGHVDSWASLTYTPWVKKIETLYSCP